MAVFRYTWRTFAREAMLVVGVLLFCLPFYLLVTIALKTTTEAYADPMSFPGDPQFENFSFVWESGLGQSLLNSLVITVGALACLIGLGSVTAYTIARRNTKLSAGLFLFFVIAIIIPAQLAVVPLYVVLRELSLLGSYAGMILLYTSLLLPLTVFLYTGFIRAVPVEYEEAAQVDGASLMRTFFRVVFPLLKPITGTVAVLAGLIIWNDFFTQLIFLTGSKNETLPVAVFEFANQEIEEWNFIFAAVAIAVAPLVLFFAFTQRHLVRGFTGGIRG